MTDIKKSFFGANDVEDGDDLKMASSVVFGDAGHEGEADGSDLTIRLRVFDGETKEKKIVEIEETKTWDWKDPGIWLVINGWQVTSYSRLVSVLRQKQENGVEEIEILVAPRFSMLSGG
jgi:hypothetical protein